jgi:nucleotide-binding universal stress UspA family protein
VTIEAGANRQAQQGEGAMVSFGAVLVGIDGSEVAQAALIFAAEEASRRGARLVVAHAGDVPDDPDPTVRSFGEIVCREAITTVAALDPQLHGDVVIRDVSAGDLLIELSTKADLLVVGTHRTGRLRGWVLGSVSQFVAAHAHCPVITISGAPDHGDGPVVLGASASPGGMAALRFACEEARLRGVPVRAIRSITTEDWALSSPANAMLLGADVLYEMAQSELDMVCAAAKESYPDVSVNGELSKASPFVALLQAAGDAAMLVIGSHRSRASVLPHLGPVAAWLLHQSACPLAVVGYEAQDERDPAAAVASDVSGVGSDA